MDLTPARWFIGIALGCATLAAVLSVEPRVSAPTWSPGPPKQLEDAMSGLRDAAIESQSAVRAYRLAQALDRWSSSPSDGGPVRFDRSVPATTVKAARAIVQDQWTRLGPAPSAAHAEVFIYVDSAAIPRATNATNSRVVIEPRRLVEVRFALPEATDGQRCLVLVRLRGTTAAHIEALRNERLAGVCAFFAVFGLPGTGVARWLSSTGYTFARQSDWDVPRAPSTDPRAFYGLSVAGSGCLTGKANACVLALGAISAADSTSARAAMPRVASALNGSGPRVLTSPTGPAAALGDVEGRLLSDMVRDLGPERFARFWRADSAPDVALAAATGTSLDVWTHGWLMRAYGAAPEDTSIEVTDALWLAAAMPFLVLVAARRRERVLAEWPLRSRR